MGKMRKVLPQRPPQTDEAADLELEHPVPPAAVAYPYLQEHMQTADGSKWYMCGACAGCDAKQRQRSAHLVYCPPDYTETLISADPVEAQMLSVVDTNTLVEERWGGFAHGELHPSSQLTIELVSFNRASADADPNLPPPYISQPVQDLLAINTRHNPVLRKFKCMLERVRPRQGVPVLDASSISNITRSHQRRDPTPLMQDEKLRRSLGVLQHTAATNMGEGPKIAGKVQKAGILTLRTDRVQARLQQLLTPASSDDVSAASRASSTSTSTSSSTGTSDSDCVSSGSCGTAPRAAKERTVPLFTTADGVAVGVNGRHHAGAGPFPHAVPGRDRPLEAGAGDSGLQRVPAAALAHSLLGMDSVQALRAAHVPTASGAM